MKSFIYSAVLSILLIPFTAKGAEKPDLSISFESYSPSDSLKYSARQTEYNLEDESLILTGDAEVHYQGRRLKSHKIIYYQQEEYLEAFGRKDPETGELTETPIFTDYNGDQLHGESIQYNLTTEQGVITRGKTFKDNAYLGAERIKKVSDDVFYLKDATYTTCDHEDHPHFYFKGSRMKYIMDDKVIIQPITAYLFDIPVFWFPYYVFSAKQGRQSGLLTPRYGSSRVDGRYLSNLGYYFAPSDYWDARFAATIREHSGWMVNSWFNYNVRYLLSGSAFGSYEDRSAIGGSREWRLNLSHSQTVSPTLNITGNGSFGSTQYSYHSSGNLYEQLNRDLRSSLSMTKRWERSGNSLMSSMTYDKNLDSGYSSSTLPDISFRMPAKPLFGASTPQRTRLKYQNQPASLEKRWYETIYYSFNGRFRNNLTERESSDFNRQLILNASLSSSNRLMGWLVTEPFINLSENFTANSRALPGQRYQRQDNFSLGLNLGTTMYGMFRPNIGNVNAMRHVLSPSLSWTYGKQVRSFGEEFDTFFQIDPDSSHTRTSNSVNVNIRNLFQAKLRDGDNEKKIDLFTLNFSSGMNFEADIRPIYPIQTSLDFRPSRSLSTRLTASHSLYDSEDRFTPFEPTLENMTVSTSFGYHYRPSFTSSSKKEDANTTLGEDEFETSVLPDYSGSPLPFRINLYHSYGIRRIAGTNDYRTIHTIKPDINISPAKGFNIQYYLSYDIENRSISYQRLLINRDLHCWEASLSWVPSGLQEGFYLRVNIKEMPDIKVERRRGGSSAIY